jgi:hypothetical protein
VNTKFSKLLAPSAALLAAASLYSIGLASQGDGGNNAASAGVIPAQSPLVTSAAAGGASALLVLGPGVAGTTGYLVHTSPPSTSVAGTATPHLSGLARQPGTRTYFASGGMSDGGNIYTLNPSGAVLVGPSGFAAVSGLAWNGAGTALYGTVTVSILADGLVQINPLTGAATLIGPMGGGVGGIDALGFDPTTGTLYGSTGFFFDGSPGDEIVINPATGAASKTGVMSPTPTCTVAGMTFSDTGTGYISIGCGAGSGGDVYTWNPATNSISLVINATGFSSSASAIEVMR